VSETNVSEVNVSEINVPDVRLSTEMRPISHSTNTLLIAQITL